MEFIGKIIKVFPKTTGTSKSSGKAWSNIEFLVEDHEQFPHKAVFRVFGDEKVANFEKYNKEGDEVKVSFDIETSEYQGRYYTRLNAWRVEKADAAASQPQAQSAAPAPQPAPVAPTQQEAAAAEGELPF